MQSVKDKKYVVNLRAITDIQDNVTMLLDEIIDGSRPGNCFSYFSMQTYVVGTCIHQKCLVEALLMSTHNI